LTGRQPPLIAGNRVEKNSSIVRGPSILGDYCTVPRRRPSTETTPPKKEHHQKNPSIRDCQLAVYEAGMFPRHQIGARIGEFGVRGVLSPTRGRK